MRNILIPAVIVSSLLGSSAAYSTNLITAVDPTASPPYDGTLSGATLTSGGTVTTGSTGFVSATFQIDASKNYRLTYTTSSSALGNIFLYNGSYALPTTYYTLLSGNYSTGTSLTFGPTNLIGFGSTAFLYVSGLSNETLTNFLLEAFNLGPDAANTTLGLIANQNAIRSLLSQRSSAIMTMMDYDCDTFDAKGYCVSFRARYTAMDSQNEGAGVFTAAYRASEKVRIGAFVDYRASEKDSTGLKQGDTMPTVGAFAAYSQSGNATGFQAKASVAYNSGKVTVTRAGNVADNTEAGSGNTNGALA